MVEAAGGLAADRRAGGGMSTFHHAHTHAHPHAHGRRGVHDHRHGHRGRRATSRRDMVPWPHWFAVHRHVHPDPIDEHRLTVPEAPGERRD